MSVGKPINPITGKREGVKEKKKPGRKPGLKAISDEVFFTVLRKCGGLASQTAEILRVMTGSEFTRQAVWQRMKNHPEIVEDIREAELDKAEKRLTQIMNDDFDNKVALDATKFYLKTIGKNRGFVERSEVTGAEGKDLPAPVIQVIMPKGN